MPPWDAVGQLGNLRRVGNPPTTGAQLTKLSGKRAVLENPPKPNAKLLAAAKSLPKRK